MSRTPASGVRARTKTRRNGGAHARQRHIQSIEVGFRLIRALEKAETKLPLKDLAARAGMAPSKAHLYLVSFLRLGLVVQDPRTAWYGLGPYAIRLGLAGMRQLEVTEVALGPMEELQEKTGVAVYLSVWGNHGPVIVMKLDKRLEAPVSIRVGYVLPLLSTATGRVFLACMPPADTAPLVAAERVSRAVRARADLAIAAVQRHGVAFSDGRHHQGLAALAAPIFDQSGALAGSVTLLGLQQRMDINPRGAMAQELRRSAQAISATLGHHAAPAAKASGKPKGALRPAAAAAR